MNTIVETCVVALWGLCWCNYFYSSEILGTRKQQISTNGSSSKLTHNMASIMRNASRQTMVSTPNSGRIEKPKRGTQKKKVETTGFVAGGLRLFPTCFPLCLLLCLPQRFPVSLTFFPIFSCLGVPLSPIPSPNFNLSPTFAHCVFTLSPVLCRVLPLTCFRLCPPAFSLVLLPSVSQ